MHQKAQARLFPASKSKIIAPSILRGAVSLGTTRLRVLQALMIILVARSGAYVSLGTTRLRVLQVALHTAITGQTMFH